MKKLIAAVTGAALAFMAFSPQAEVLADSAGNQTPSGIYYSEIGTSINNYIAEREAGLASCEVCVFDGDGEIFRLEACAVADRAFDECHLLLKAFADVLRFAFRKTAEKVRDDAFERLAPFMETAVHIRVENDDFRARTVEEDLPRGFRNVLPWRGERESVLLGKTA